MLTIMCILFWVSIFAIIVGGTGSMASVAILAAFCAHLLIPRFIALMKED